MFSDSQFILRIGGLAYYITNALTMSRTQTQTICLARGYLTRAGTFVMNNSSRDLYLFSFLFAWWCKGQISLRGNKSSLYLRNFAKNTSYCLTWQRKWMFNTILIQVRINIASVWWKTIYSIWHGSTKRSYVNRPTKGSLKFSLNHCWWEERRRLDFGVVIRGRVKISFCSPWNVFDEYWNKNEVLY